MIRQKSAQEIEEKIKQVLNEYVNNEEFEELNVFSLKAGIVKNDIEIAKIFSVRHVESSINEVKENM